MGLFDDHGHLSVRTEPGADTFYINANASVPTVNLRDMVEVDLNADQYPDAAPGETTLHASVYRKRDDVNAISHNHAQFGVVVSAVGLEIRPLHLNGTIQIDPVSVYEDYHQDGGLLVINDEEGEDVADTLGDDRAVMLRGHGAIVVGETLDEAVVASVKLEYNCKLLFQQSLVGDPWYLPRDLLEEHADRLFTEHHLEKSLDYYFSGV